MRAIILVKFIVREMPLEGKILTLVKSIFERFTSEGYAPEFTVMLKLSFVSYGND